MMFHTEIKGLSQVKWLLRFVSQWQLKGSQRKIFNLLVLCLTLTNDQDIVTVTRDLPNEVTHRVSGLIHFDKVNSSVIQDNLEVSRSLFPHVENSKVIDKVHTFVLSTGHD